MTFTEAALEVLRSAGEPLHYKKITELAIAGNLLSHVGKTPEVTMSSRLATLVKKDRGQSPIIKVRPGVFAIRESAMHTEKDSSTSTSVSEAEAQPARPESLPVERPKLPGADVFPEEDDDDAPILAGLEEPAEERGRRRRRRRRRGGKGDAIEPAAGREHGRAEGRHEARDRDRNGRRDGGRPESRREYERSEAAELDLGRQPGEGDLLGKDLADAAYSVLARSERAPHGFARVADLLVRRGRLSGSPEALAPTVAAALRADVARAQRSHGRSRFRITGSQVSLSEWLLPHDAVRSAENVERGAENQREQVRRAFMGRLNDLPAAGFAELIATWLNAEGVTALRAVRRPGSSGREFHFAGTLRRGAEENRLAIVVLRSGRDIDREAVVAVRGSLHHYGSATGAWLITTGRIASQAREEAAAEGAAPCALFAGADLARAMEKLGIGLRLHFVPLCDIDFDLLESLGDAGLLQARSRPERDRDRNRSDRDRSQRRDQRGAERQDEGDDGSEAAEELEAGADPDLDDESAALENEGGELEGGEEGGLDLLDPEAAEASRLPAHARRWDEDDAEPEDSDADDAPTGEHDVADVHDEDDDERREDDEDEPEDLSASAADEEPALDGEDDAQS